jgi:hypothetical protein
MNVAGEKKWIKTELVFIPKLATQVLFYVSVSQSGVISGTTKHFLSQ